MLFCAGCGHAMYQQRYQNKNRKQDCYIGGRKKTAAATKQLKQAQECIAEVSRIIKRRMRTM